MHKCDGCKYKSEHQEMGFKAVGTCTQEHYLPNAIKAYNATECRFGEHKKICPICKHPLHQCQCELHGNDRNSWMRLEVVLHHLHLLSEAQLKHIVEMEARLQISYGDSERNAIVKELEEARKNVR